MAYENYDYSGIEAQLKQRAQQNGLEYDPSDLEGIKRNASYTDASGTFTGTTPEQGLQNAFATYQTRATNATPQPQTPTQQWNSQPAQSPQSDQLMQFLMQRAQQGTTVSRTDPNVRQQVDPAVAQMERQNRTALDQIAEKAGPLANLTGERRLAAERTGQAAGQLESEVIGREVDARRQEIAQALSLWGNQLTAQQQLALQKELAYLSDQRAAAGQQLQSQSLSQSQDQFLRELALREADQNNRWDYNWATLGA